MRVFRGLLILAVAVSLMTATMGCGKKGGRRSGGSAQGTGGTDVPKKD